MTYILYRNVTHLLGCTTRVLRFIYEKGISRRRSSPTDGLAEEVVYPSVKRIAKGWSGSAVEKSRKDLSPRSHVVNHLYESLVSRIRSDIITVVLYKI